jgi:hypothetical protein
MVGIGTRHPLPSGRSVRRRAASTSSSSGETTTAGAGNSSSSGGTSSSGETVIEGPCGTGTSSSSGGTTIVQTATKSPPPQHCACVLRWGPSLHHT